VNADRQSVILTAQQCKNPPVGSGGGRFVGFFAKLTPPWRVLAMSDGVWKYAGLDNIVRIAAAKKGQEIVDAIRQAAGMRGNGRLQDDFTLVAFVGES
jgi:hypothetical protein